MDVARSPIVTVMIDAHRMEGTFWAWRTFTIVVFAIGVAICTVATAATTFTVGGCFVASMLGLSAMMGYTAFRDRWTAFHVLRSGRVAEAVITHADTVQQYDDIIPSSFAACRFTAHVHDGHRVVVEAKLPPQVHETFHVGDRLAVRYDPRRPRICMQDVRDGHGNSTLSIAPSLKNVMAGVLCLSIVVGYGLHSGGSVFQFPPVIPSSGKLWLEYLLLVSSIVLIVYTLCECVLAMVRRFGGHGNGA